MRCAYCVIDFAGSSEHAGTAKIASNISERYKVSYFKCNVVLRFARNSGR
jgi:hypothetical protein